MRTDIGNFFAFLMVNSPTKSIVVAGATASVTIVPFLLYSIIWYDKFGSDKRRTFLNMITSSICWLFIEYLLTIQTTEVVRYLWGPMPEVFCFWKTLFRAAYITQIYLYSNTIAITRYLFIFWLKNPAAFPSEFWYVFFNIWIKAVSLIINFVWFMVSEKQVIGYFICCGLDPRENFKKQQKVYKIHELIAIFITLTVLIRIKIYKMLNPDKNDPRSKMIKYRFISDINSQTIANLSTTFVYCLLLLISMSASNFFTKLHPNDLHIYKNYMFLYYLLSPGLFLFCYASMYYIHHKPLRATIATELKTFWEDFWEDMKK